MAVRTIAVVGATGTQGGSLVRSILGERSGDAFAVRALTRDPDAPRARALAGAGATVVRADLDDVESLTQAFAGAYGAFCVTNFWEHLSPRREAQQARNLAEAAGRAGLRHVVWSTLEDTRERIPLDDPRMPTLMGSYKVPHFDAKGESDRWFRVLGVPTTYLRTSFYWDNFLQAGFGPCRGEDGVLVLSLPMGEKRLAGIAAEDIGRCAHGIFRTGTAMAGETVGIAGGHLTGRDMAAQMAEALGEEVRYADVPVQDFRTLGFPAAEEAANMFQYYQEFEEEFCAARPIDRTRELNPALLTFAGWLVQSADRLVAGAPAAEAV